ncbi:Selenide, water dikinase [Jimgerdemannia flammicorona]|uniref:Selenide, water dikinase n=2 Tax=Jimgerdemannia flammicorona TaxID=994334 RepID=A0A433D904_9FUNG|nr:Selenide, water dikinase [Jimgerdemannia flammicorona]RUS26983.1 Selenide, water dikinase [Jimgerdemannia flammicorona]
MDSAVMNTRFDGIKLVQTTDFFYPNIDDPYLMGKITCANVLSDLYAMGVTECDNMLMLLGISQNLQPEDRDIVVKMIINGFNGQFTFVDLFSSHVTAALLTRENLKQLQLAPPMINPSVSMTVLDLATEAGTMVTGGQTVKNPWLIVGGVATSVVKESELIMPINAVSGDVLILTKPLGTQVAVNANLYLLPHNKEKWERIKHVVNEDQVRESYDTATMSMARLNRVGAQLMHKYGAHAATDVTGFGLIGHANNLASNQTSAVSFEFHTLPLIKHMHAVNAIASFRLMEGRSAETSGGLLIAIPADKAQQFVKEIEELDGWPAFVIGNVVEGDRTARILENATIIEVEQHHLN